MFFHPFAALRRALALVCLLCPAVAHAQRESAAPPPYNPGAVEFAPDPLRVESLGLSMLLPVGATSQATVVGTLATIRIEPELQPGQSPGDSPWMVDIQTIREIPERSDAPDDPGDAWQPPSNTLMADRTIDAIRRSFGKVDQRGDVIESQARLLFREQNLSLKGTGDAPPLRAERFYISIPDASGKARLVRGTTFCQIDPSRFLAFTLWVRESEFEKTRPIYEAMIASATLSDPAETGLARAALIEAGRHILSALTEDDYRAIIEARGERWDRLYKLPSSGDDALAIERGYRRTRVWRGYKGELNPDRDRAKWKSGEEREGYLVSYEYRLLDDPEHPPADGRWTMSDAAAVYFMTPDSREEVWVVRQTQRGPRAAPGTVKETGARFDNKMQVTIEGPGIAPVTVKPVFNAEGYISQVQTFLLPQLLVRGGIPADYGFYCYQSSTRKVQLRRDSLRQPPDRPDVWELRFRPAEDSPEMLMLLSPSGDLIRSELPGGWVWEPTTAERLVSLWKRKGLPME